MRADPGPGPRDGRTATARPGVLCRLCRVRDCDGLRAVLLWFAQQGTVTDDGLLHRLGEVLPDVPPVRHVDGVRRAEPSGLGEREGMVAADHLDTGMAGQPLGHVDTFRSDSRSTGRLVSMSTRTVALTCPLRSANSATPSTLGVCGAGSSRARIRRSSVERLAGPRGCPPTGPPPDRPASAPASATPPADRHCAGRSGRSAR